LEKQENKALMDPLKPSWDCARPVPPLSGWPPHRIIADSPKQTEAKWKMMKEKGSNRNTHKSFLKKEIKRKKNPQ